MSGKQASHLGVVKLYTHTLSPGEDRRPGLYERCRAGITVYNARTSSVYCRLVSEIVTFGFGLVRLGFEFVRTVFELIRFDLGLCSS